MLSQCSSKSKRVCGSVKRSQDCSSGCWMCRPLSVVFEACSNSLTLSTTYGLSNSVTHSRYCESLANTGLCLFHQWCWSIRTLTGIYVNLDIFASIAIGVIPLLLMSIFSISAGNNLRSNRARIQPVQHIRIHQQDHDLMKMLAGEVIIYCLIDFTYPVNLMYGYFTRAPLVDKTLMRLTVKSLISFILDPSLSFTYCAM